MKIGLISDVHAYLKPLEDVFSFFEREGVEHIICAGDIVDGGEDGDAVVAQIRSRSIACVQGNHDQDVFADQAWIRRTMRHTGEATHPLLLTPQTTAYVSGLPLKLDLEFSGIKICLTHGTPWSNTTYLFPDMDEQCFRDVAKATDADVVVLGHTHMPMYVQVGQKRIINSGSVYSNRFDEGRTCGILHLPNMAFEVFDLSTHKLVSLNIRKISTE